ncbi:MAG: excisionase family DNA-binding protein [Planctomycetota bacterium]
MDAQVENKRYLSVAEVAGETGLSQAFWRKAIFLRRVAFVRVGRRVLVRREDLDSFIQAGIVPAVRAGAS